MIMQLTTEQLKALGMESMATSARDRVFQRLGKVVFDSAIVRLIDTFTDEQIEALNHTIESYDSFDAVVDFLERAYPQFSQFLQEEQERCAGLFVTKVVHDGWQ